MAGIQKYLGRPINMLLKISLNVIVFVKATLARQWPYSSKITMPLKHFVGTEPVEELLLTSPIN